MWYYFQKKFKLCFFCSLSYRCSRILVQSTVQVIKKNFFSYLLVSQMSFLEFASEPRFNKVAGLKCATLLKKRL